MKLFMLMKLLAVLLTSASCELWSPSKILESWFTINPKFQTEKVLARSKFSAAVKCSMRSWCQAFCPMSADFMLLALITVPYNEDKIEDSPVDCFTKRKRSNILTAQSNISVLDSTNKYNTFRKRSVDNLLNGVYNYNIDECFFSTFAKNPYVVFDLGSTIYVRNALAVAQPNKQSRAYFQDIDIRVGEEAPTASGDFQSYTQLGYLEGPASYANYEFMTDSSFPILGRYLSIQSMKTKRSQIQLCHVEIYVYRNRNNQLKRTTRRTKTQTTPNLNNHGKYAQRRKPQRKGRKPAPLTIITPPLTPANSKPHLSKTQHKSRRSQRTPLTSRSSPVQVDFKSYLPCKPAQHLKCWSIYHRSIFKCKDDFFNKKANIKGTIVTCPSCSAKRRRD
ncbi:Galactose-binding domain-like [Trinorchestia longiramus]|nr:Galactose-binding domain-like [Trinorchestia longiramus]